MPRTRARYRPNKLTLYLRTHLFPAKACASAPLRMLYHRPMTHTIGFGASKGGVGKSTLTCGVTAVLSQYTTRKILTIDAGGQHNTLLYLDGISKRGELHNVDYDAADDKQTLSSLRAVDAGHLFHLIDLPGYTGADELHAILRGSDGTPVTDLLVVPMAPSEFDLESVVPFVKNILEPAGIAYGVVICKAGPRALAESLDLQSQLEADGVDVFRTIVREYRGVRDAQRDRKPITTAGGRHAEVRKAEDDIRGLTREILKRVGSRIHIPTRADEAQESRHG